jgi:DNA replication protein DnaC
MLIQPTIDGLKTLKLFGMLKALESQMDLPDVAALCFEERLGMLIDTELTTRANRQTQMRLKLAKLAHSATMEELEPSRGIDRAALASLATCEWLRRKQNIIVNGATGVGKSFLACALANKACREGFSVHFDRASRLFECLAISRADGRYGKVMATIAAKNLLVIDDFGLFKLTEEQRQDLLEVIEDRYSRGSVIITSQIPVEHWHEIVGDPTIADAILDRVVHNAHKLHLKGESKRREKAEEMQLIR